MSMWINKEKMKFSTVSLTKHIRIHNVTVREKFGFFDLEIGWGQIWDNSGPETSQATDMNITEWS